MFSCKQLCISEALFWLGCQMMYPDVCCRRHKVVNYFSLMLQQRMRSGDEDGDLEDPEEGKAKKSSGGNRKGLCHTVTTYRGPERPFIAC
jgi:hypothetical protein